jgi:hypothetical protein
VPVGSEVGRDTAERGQEPLGCAGAPEALHRAFALSRSFLMALGGLGGSRS